MGPVQVSERGIDVGAEDQTVTAGAADADEGYALTLEQRLELRNGSLGH